jgi:hypothetical protein
MVLVKCWLPQEKTVDTGTLVNEEIAKILWIWIIMDPVQLSKMPSWTRSEIGDKTRTHEAVARCAPPHSPSQCGFDQMDDLTGQKPRTKSSFIVKPYTATGTNRYGSRSNHARSRFFGFLGALVVRSLSYCLVACIVLEVGHSHRHTDIVDKLTTMTGCNF